MVVVTTEPYDRRIKRQIQTDRSGGRVHFVIGDALDTKNLQAWNVGDAAAIFLLAPHHIHLDLHPEASSSPTPPPLPHQVKAKVMSKAMGTPAAKAGVCCIGLLPDDSDEETDWKGFETN